MKLRLSFLLFSLTSILSIIGTFIAPLTAEAVNCTLSDVSASHAAPNEEITLSGDLGDICSVKFKDANGNMLDAPITYTSSSTMKVKVPSNAAPGNASIYTAVKGGTYPGFPWAFRIVSGATCEITSFSPNPAETGTAITITGNNISPVFCNAVFKDSAGAQFSVNTTYGDNTHLKAMVPSKMASGQGSVALIDTSKAAAGSPVGLPLSIKEYPCEIISVSPGAQTRKGSVTLKANNFDGTCDVYFRGPGQVEQAVNGRQIQSGGYVKTTVPDTASIGKGVVTTRQSVTTRVQRELPFEILPPVPVLQSLSTTGAAPGNHRVTVTGTNFDYLGSSKAFIELQNGEKFETPIGNNNATKFDLMVIPNVYQGFNDTSKRTQHRARILQPKSLYVEKGAQASNKLTLNVKSPYPILDQINKTTVYPGDIIAVKGGNWDVAQIFTYTAVFHLPGGKTHQTKVLPSPVVVPPSSIPDLPNMTLVGAFAVKIPDVFSGKSLADQNAIEKGTTQLSIFGPDTLESNKLNIKIKKKPLNIPNPYKLDMPADYTGAPNRSINYTGSSTIVLPDHTKKAVITKVKNTCTNGFKLYYKDKSGNYAGNSVWLNPGDSTDAFNGKDANAKWEAIGPESGSIVHRDLIMSIDISWKTQ